jgi:hypothetical protein
VKGAAASLDDDDFLRLVSSPAAHEVAAVDADARVVALPSVRPQYPQLGVLLAEGRRGLEVDEVLNPRRLVLRVVRLQLEVIAVPTRQTLALRVHRIARGVARYGVAHTPDALRVAHHDPRGAVEAVLQVVAHLPKRRQSHPAGLDGARARHPVALALLAHLRRDVLQHEEQPGFHISRRRASNVRMPRLPESRTKARGWPRESL